MKISGNSTPIQMDGYLKQIHQQQQQASSQQQANEGRITLHDKVELSPEARVVQQAAKALKQMPDVREEKVQNTKMQVDSGTYKVVGAQVATDMLRETFENDALLQKINTRA
jgi:negative regulator of flagellin synthesis FlgM